MKSELETGDIEAIAQRVVELLRSRHFISKNDLPRSTKNLKNINF